MSLEVWGTYGKNEEEFLKNIEIAIQSKVDGILIQGMDTPEFKELTKVKASFNGIPVITVANDVPMSESLRRTYIGSDPFEAGKLMADALVKQMGDVGKVVLMVDAEREYNQNERIRGIRSVLDDHPGSYDNGKKEVEAKQTEVIVVDKENVKEKLIDSKYYEASEFTGLE